MPNDHLTVAEFEEIHSSQLPGGMTVDRLLTVQAADLTDEEKKSVTPFRLIDRHRVQVRGWVGVVEVDGVVIEIVPKIGASNGEVEGQRRMLDALLSAYVESGPLDNRPARRVSPTRVQAQRGPLRERIFERLVEEAEALLQNGLRFGYARTQERLPFLRGRLDFARQMRQPPGNDHRFHVRYERFDVGRPENRLLKTALLRVASRSSQPDLRLRANQAAGILADVPVSHAIARDLALWDRGRLLAHYGAVEPWCRLTLQPMIGTRIGTDQADALLWKTEKMFERALENALDRRITASGSGLSLAIQGRRDGEGRGGRSGRARAIFLGVDEADRPSFELQPDLMLLQGQRVVSVLDAKWKEVDAVADMTAGDGGTAVISREDAYQMHAYGHRLLGGSGPLVVIYPAWEGFRVPRTYTLGRSGIGVDLTLTAVPYDLLADRFLLGPPDSRAREALGEVAPLLDAPAGVFDGPALTASA